MHSLCSRALFPITHIVPMHTFGLHAWYMCSPSIFMGLQCLCHHLKWFSHWYVTFVLVCKYSHCTLWWWLNGSYRWCKVVDTRYFVTPPTYYLSHMLLYLILCIGRVRLWAPNILFQEACVFLLWQKEPAHFQILNRPATISGATGIEPIKVSPNLNMSDTNLSC